jgi:S-layer homology domain
MKKVYLSVLLLFMALGTLLGPGGKAEAASFKDVPGNYWASKEIHYLAGSQIIKGYTNGNFGINDPVKRMHVAVMLSRTLELDGSSSPDPGFKDVPATHPAYKEIAACVEAGIFNKGEYFNPEKNITRAQMAKVLAESFMIAPVFTVPFKDVKASDWFYKNVQALANYNITTGSNGYFKPSKSLTRTEFAVFLARIMDPKFRPGFHAVAESASYNSSGNLEAKVTIYNNTKYTISDISGRFSLYADGELAAEQAYTKENPYPVKYGTLTMAPGTTKSVTVEFKASEIKSNASLEDKYLEILFMYEYKYR